MMVKRTLEHTQAQVELETTKLRSAPPVAKRNPAVGDALDVHKSTVDTVLDSEYVPKVYPWYWTVEFL